MNSVMEEYRKDKTQPCFQGWGGQSRKEKGIEEDILMKMVLENLKKKWKIITKQGEKYISKRKNYQRKGTDAGIITAPWDKYKVEDRIG